MTTRLTLAVDAEAKAVLEEHGLGDPALAEARDAGGEVVDLCGDDVVLTGDGGTGAGDVATQRALLVVHRSTPTWDVSCDRCIPGRIEAPGGWAVALGTNLHTADACRTTTAAGGGEGVHGAWREESENDNAPPGRAEQGVSMRRSAGPFRTSASCPRAQHKHQVAGGR